MSEVDPQPLMEEPVPNSDRLYLIFGGRKAGMGVPQFEFCKAANILDHNKIYIRDLKQSWYQMGLPGLSDDLNSTATYLKKVVRKYGDKKLITVGNSMGGFAAIFFAAALGNAHAIAFAPQTFIGPIDRFIHKDKRWNREILHTYAATLFKRKHFNLKKALKKETDSNWEADVVIGSGHRLDLLHAKSLENFPQIRIRKYPSNEHRVVKELRDQGHLADILEGNFSESIFS